MAKRKGVHPLVSAVTLAPLAIGLLSPKAHHTFPTARTTHPIEVVGQCTLPFDAIAVHHPIDDSCGLSGNESDDTTARALQNQAKNNLCARRAPVNIDFEVLRQLQSDAESQGITFGSDGQIPSDRSVLQHLPTKAGSLGEGTVARIAAFVIKAHYSNVGKGESVNCKQPDKESNDIHIVLGENSNHDDECSSVTAEMSPHFRPDTWDPSVLTDHNEHLYRFTGQIFFDASHRPCSGGKGSPKRSAIWELHPVYGVDICNDPGNNCTVDNDQNWVALSDFVGTGTPPSETRLWFPENLLKDTLGRPAR